MISYYVPAKRIKVSITVWTFTIMLAIMLPSILSEKAEVHAQSIVTGLLKTTQSQSTLEKGIVYPRYAPFAYGQGDPVWQGSLPVIKSQTASRWIEMPVLFEQPTSTSTTVAGGLSTPSLASFTYGVQTAHAEGLHVYLVPLLVVRQVGAWAGTILATNPKNEQAWFDSYWNIFKPYVQAAADNNVEQIAIGTEMEKLELSASSALWNQFITRMRSIYSKTLTYDMNFSTMTNVLPAWVSNKNLAMIGISTYFQLTPTAKRVDPKAMPDLWRIGAKVKLDAFAKRIGKPVLISEIGYRNNSDAFYQPWAGTSHAPLDPQEQAGAFDAAFSNIMTDPSIAGVFVWGWNGAQQLSISEQPATLRVIYKWYTKN